MSLFRHPSSRNPLAILAGSGMLPHILLQNACRQGYQAHFFGVQGLTQHCQPGLALSCEYFSMGRLEDLLNSLKKIQTKYVVLAGGLPKTSILSKNQDGDEAFQKVMSVEGNRGDDNLLRAFALYLRVRLGIHVLDSRFLLKDILASKGPMNSAAERISKRQEQDIKLGRKLISKMGKMDVGQSVFIKDGVFLAVEALEGTDKAIERAGGLSDEGLVMIKMTKPSQDLRFDLPCVGTETIDRLIKAKASVLALEADKTIMLEKNKLLDSCQRAKIAVIGV